MTTFDTTSELQTAVEAWCTNATSAEATYGQISAWDVSKITNMANLFDTGNRPCSSFNDNINSWDTSKVVSMSEMFEGAAAFDQPLDSWNMSKVQSMQAMRERMSKQRRPLHPPVPHPQHGWPS